MFLDRTLSAVEVSVFENMPTELKDDVVIPRKIENCRFALQSSMQCIRFGDDAKSLKTL